MLNKKIKWLQFRFGILRTKHSHWKLVKHYLKTLKFCLHYIHKIGAPTNDTEEETIKRLISLYDETIADISKDVEWVRRYLDHIKV